MYALKAVLSHLRYLILELFRQCGIFLSYILLSEQRIRKSKYIHPGVVVVHFKEYNVLNIIWNSWLDALRHINNYIIYFDVYFTVIYITCCSSSFVCLRYVSCVQCCPCLYIVHSWLSLRFSLTLINNVQIISVIFFKATSDFLLINME
jgi:hypothetical protein